MRQNRYRQPKLSGDESLPLDTICTILTRQSTSGQAERNLFSAEVNPDELIQVAQRFGFLPERITLLDWDMGISAYNTTIEDRPALHHWLTKLLPCGESRVVLVSQEDRLFRDRTEIQVNRFIEQVSQHGGWVICGQRVYDFRHEMDREQFRMVCKYGRQYIEHHVKGRLHPAQQRAALRGRYVGGRVPWGYVVDYQLRSETYKRYIAYQPHAQLVGDHIFHRFMNMARPGLQALANAWWRDKLVFPYFTEEVDPRSWRWIHANCRHEDALGGYVLSRDSMRAILTDVSYLGWRVRVGETALDEAGTPKVWHQPLIEPDVFWWCFDRIESERPKWAPARQVTLRLARVRTTSYEGRDGVKLLGHGLLRCASHSKIVAPILDHLDKPRLSCTVTAHQHDTAVCRFSNMAMLEQIICQSFTQQLTLDDRDVRQLAMVAQRRTEPRDGELMRTQRLLAEHKQVFEQAKQNSLRAPDMAEDYLPEMRQAKAAIKDLEARIAALRTEAVIAPRSWLLAQRAAKIAERIRSTFGDWSRSAQSRVIALALQQGVIGHVSRHSSGLWLHWAGGKESRHVLVRRFGKHVLWTIEEDAALRAYYDKLTQEALCAMLPGRHWPAIAYHALQMGLSRQRGARFAQVPPYVLPAVEVTNEMEGYGFPLATANNDVSPEWFCPPHPCCLPAPGSSSCSLVAAASHPPLASNLARSAMSHHPHDASHERN